MTLLSCVLFVVMLAWFENLCLFVCMCFKCFHIVVFYQSFLVFVSKIPKHIKTCIVISMFCLVSLYLWLCAFTSIACSLCTHIIVGEIYVIVVNKSSNSSWIIIQWFCWFWDMHRLVPIYLLTCLLFFLKELNKCKSPNEKR